jgi:hypothetical protein
MALRYQDILSELDALRGRVPVELIDEGILSLILNNACCAQSIIK